jgi:Zn-dependent membrane protease YugP
MFLDPIYFLFVGPAILLAMWAQWRVQSAYAEASQVPAASGLTGAQAAHAVMEAGGMGAVEIEPVEGMLSDHYDPRGKVLRLSEGVYAQRSLAALGIAAHEAGHAIQDAHRYPLLVARNALVPLASVGSNISWLLIMIGFVLMSMSGGHSGMFWVKAGIVAFSMTVLFQLVNLPVEFDASRRAKAILLSEGLITPDEAPTVKRVLDAAAMTYVAATLTGILTLLYFLYRAGLLGGRRD